MKMHRFADFLTLCRLGFSLLIPLIVTPYLALVLFSLLFFTDYLDGVVARKFPDPHKETRFYNKLPISFDNCADIALFAGGLLWIILRNAWMVSSASRDFRYSLVRNSRRQSILLGTK
ncbi:MAG: CDP-alcohol phosphatidyltransferase family protein [Candidatus Saccharimonadales bacterium]